VRRGTEEFWGGVGEGAWWEGRWGGWTRGVGIVVVVVVVVRRGEGRGSETRVRGGDGVSSMDGGAGHVLRVERFRFCWGRIGVGISESWSGGGGGERRRAEEGYWRVGEGGGSWTIADC